VRLGGLLASGRPAALEYHDARIPFAPDAPRVPWFVFAYPYYLLLAAGWIWCAFACARWRSRGDGRDAGPLLAIVLIAPVFVALIAASNQIFDARVNRISRVPFLAYRVLVPALPALFVPLALALGRLPVLARRAAMLLVILLGTIASARIVLDGAETRSRIAREARTLGAGAVGQLLVYRHGDDVACAASVIAHLPEELRPAAFEGVGFGIAYHVPAERPPDELARAAAAAPPPYREAIVRGMRLAFGAGTEQVAPATPDGRAERFLGAVDRL
jgi:hypothetical protein